MNLLTRAIGAAAAAMALAACGSGISTTTDANPAYNISEYRTFSWISDRPMVIASGSEGPVNPLTEGRIMDATKAALTAKGYTFVEDPGASDFLVGFTVGAREQVDVNTYPSAAPYYGGYYGARRYGGGWGGAYWGTEVSTTRYTEGVLAIDFFDAASRTPVWHGRSEKTIYASDRKDPVPAINEVVAATLESVPAR